MSNGDGTVERFAGTHWNPEIIEEAKTELHRTATLAKAGLVEELTPCQKIVFELLRFEGKI